MISLVITGSKLIHPHLVITTTTEYLLHPKILFLESHTHKKKKVILRLQHIMLYEHVVLLV